MRMDAEGRVKRLCSAEHGVVGFSCDLTRIHNGAIIVKRF
jgi:hypothetical protein